jgi:hypothetical protein
VRSGLLPDNWRTLFDSFPELLRHRPKVRRYIPRYEDERKTGNQNNHLLRGVKRRRRAQKNLLIALFALARDVVGSVVRLMSRLDARL